MPDTESVIERIAIELITRLEAIRVENGFSFDVVGVIRPDKFGEAFTPQNHLIVVSQGDSTYNAESSHEGNPPAIAFDTAFEINCLVRESDRLQTEIASSTNEMISAAMKAIVTQADDPSVWYQMAGNAINCNWGGISPYSQTDGTHAGGTLTLIVLHRQSEDDPYEARA
jgi:hypothetical protein